MKIENCHPKIEDRIDLRLCPLLHLPLRLLLLLGLGEVPPVAPRCRELGTVRHFGHGAELAGTLVPGHP